MYDLHTRPGNQEKAKKYVLAEIKISKNDNTY